MPKFVRWSPDTCTCRHLYVITEDDGSSRMASVKEVQEQHEAEYEAWAAAFEKASGLRRDQWGSPQHFGLLNTLKRQRIGIPDALRNGKVNPYTSPQEPMEPCPEHAALHDDDEDAEAMEVLRGAVREENLRKNLAVAQIAEALTPTGTEEEKMAAIEGVRFRYAGEGLNRTLQLEVPAEHRAREAQLLAKVAELVDVASAPVEFVADVDAARAVDQAERALRGRPA